MNIFAVDHDPIIAGSVLPDKLTVKMPLEQAQMNSTGVIEYCPWVVHNKTWKLTYRLAHLSAWFAFWCREAPIYSPAHYNHPCSQWVRVNQSNFEWATYHGLALCEEYTARYGKVHKSQAIIEKCARYIEFFPEGSQTYFAQAMPDELKHATDATVAYRHYIQTKSYWQDRPYRKGRDFTDFYTNLTTTVPAGK